MCQICGKILSLSNSDAVYFDAVEKFSSWCKNNYLDLNVIKTKEMLLLERTRPLYLICSLME